ncbi:MAG: MerR family transcriptional regulator, partial [Pseudomonadota bacterium]
MSEDRYLRIGDVVARTGLTERMIRHYEKLGLVTPHRSTSGQRLFDRDSLLALGKVRLLKQAGMPLDLIEKWLSNPLDARGLIETHLGYLRNESDRIAAAIALLKDIDAELSDGNPAEIDHLARIIATAEDADAEARARAFFERQFSKAQRDDWRELTERLREEIDPHEYDDAWRSLIADIKAALPLDPSAPAAQSFLQRWNALLAPFKRVASEAQQKMAREMWSNVG